MNFRQKIAVSFLLHAALCGAAFAQVVDFLDPNLRAAVAESIGVDPDRITQIDLRWLDRLDLVEREIENLEGLQHAPNLRLLDLSGNPISDLTPLANLTNLEELLLSGGRISDLTPLANLRNLEILILNRNDITDISPLGRLTNLWVLKMPSNGISNLTPLANLTNLKELKLDRNRISDISPLAGLINLRFLTINHNMITDIKALSNLTELRQLAMQNNYVASYSPLDKLSLDLLTYDQICDMPPEPLEPRLKNRSFPSSFTAFTPEIEASYTEEHRSAKDSDLIFSGHIFADDFQVVEGEWNLIFSGVEGDPFISVMGDIPLPPTHPGWREKHFSVQNANQIFLLEVRIHDAGGTSPNDAFPDDHPYWLRLPSGELAIDNGRRLINFAHPDVQDIIVGQALAIARCGFYDGVFFDWWKDSDSTVGDLISLKDAVRARKNIIDRIRAETRDNFLIVGNLNDQIVPITGPFINGGFMEGDVVSEPWIRTVRDSVQWLETNLREPRMVMVQGRSNLSEPPDSPYNQQLMRATTTMSLTHSDGYVHFTIDRFHRRLLYDFLNADLGQPVGPKFQFFENIEGLYIREFDNGWAVYNQSGKAQVVTLPEEVQSVANGRVNTEHAVLNIDGDIFLKVETANPADLNGDGIVNILDLTLVAQALGTNNLKGDVNGDGVVNVFDLVFVANQF